MWIIIKPYKLYRDVSNHAIATLIKNDDLTSENVVTEHKYRMVFLPR